MAHMASPVLQGLMSVKRTFATAFADRSQAFVQSLRRVLGGDEVIL